MDFAFKNDQQFLCFIGFSFGKSYDRV